MTSPSSDSISVESVNGLDRYWDTGSTLDARIGSDFGDSVPSTRYALREKGKLFDVLKKPMKVVVCRKGACREYYHDFAVRLPERNERSVAVTGGWNTAFTKRAVTARDKSVLLKEALNHTVWNVQAEIATGKLSGRLQGFYGADERGGSLDLSHEIKRIGDGMSYGLAITCRRHPCRVVADGERGHNPGHRVPGQLWTQHHDQGSDRKLTARHLHRW